MNKMTTNPRPNARPVRLSFGMKTLLMAGVLLCVGLPTASRAEGCDEAGETESQGGRNFHIEYRDGKKIHVIDTVVAVCGKVPRPSVVYVLQAKNIGYEWELLKQDFIPLILNSVKKAPF